MKVEIQRHRNKPLKIKKLTEDEIIKLEALVTWKITFIGVRLIPQDILTKTEVKLKAIDPNDTVFVALTKHLKGNCGQVICSYTKG